jgi:tetratricopeptide (TPR) repeat protein
MSRRFRSRHAVKVQPTIDRPAAAVLLHAAHITDASDESIEWAFTAMPDRRAAQRLRIGQLLAHGDYEAADALIGSGLRKRPTDASLSLLRARSLFAQDKFDAAAREMRLVLAQRPHHAGAMELAGQVQMKLGRPLRAVRHFQRAATRRPGDRATALVAHAWLAAGRTRTARDVVELMQNPPPLLTARLLAAEGRLLEATDTLDEARCKAHGTEYQDILCELITRLEAQGDLARLRRILVEVSNDHPVVLARAGNAWLSMGAFHTAAIRMATLARIRGYRARATTVLMVAAAMLNRTSLAERALRRLRRLDEPVEQSDVSEAWCRGLFGRLLLDQCSARRAGADPHTGRLQRLLRDARTIFEDLLADSGPGMPRTEQRDLQQHIEVCHVASAMVTPAEPAVPIALTDVPGLRLVSAPN